MIITASARPDLPELEDDVVAYTMHVADFRIVEGKDFDDPERPQNFLVVDLRLEPGAPEALGIWRSLKLGQTKSGIVSKLRALLNALAGLPEGTLIAGFDTETLEWTYPDGAVHVLEVGNRLTVRGSTKVTQAGERRFGVDRFRPAV